MPRTGNSRRASLPGPQSVCRSSRQRSTAETFVAVVGGAYQFGIAYLSDLVAGHSHRLVTRDQYRPGSNLPSWLLHERRVPGGKIRAGDARGWCVDPDPAAHARDGQHGVLPVPAAGGGDGMGGRRVVVGRLPRCPGGDLHGKWRAARGGRHRFLAGGPDRHRLGASLVGGMVGGRRLARRPGQPWGSRSGIARPYLDLRRAGRARRAAGARAVRLGHSPCGLLHRESFANDAPTRLPEGMGHAGRRDPWRLSL